MCAATREVDSVAFLLPAFLDNPGDGPEFGRNAVDAAVQAGIGMFAWNASGEVSEDNSKSNTKLPIFRHLQDSGLPSVVFEPTTYMENWLGPWTAPSVRNRDELTYPVLADRKMGWIASDDVGALVVAALERPELAGNRYRISGGIHSFESPGVSYHWTNTSLCAFTQSVMVDILTGNASRTDVMS